MKNAALRLALFGIFLVHPFVTTGEEVLMQWNFENIANRTCTEPSTGIIDTIEGNAESAPGVAGKGVRLDGFTTRIIRDSGNVKSPGHAFTVEAWVSLGEYPWNWCPVITTEATEVQGYRLMIGPLGQAALEVAVEERWITCASAQEILPLRKWMHLVGVCRDGKDLSLYVNGTLAASLTLNGAVTHAKKSPVFIGMGAAPGNPSDIIRPWGTRPAFFGLDGIIDEVKVFAGAMTVEHIQKRFSQVSVGAPEIPLYRLPVLEKNPGRFGAYYTKLKYHPGWDNLWPVEGDPDVVVCFEKSPVKFIFWRGTRYGPAWVSENENWMVDQSVETWKVGKDDTEGCFEHMQDRHCRFSHVRIIENTPARAVVHWRYALVSSHDNVWRPDEKTGWETWADEYYFIYPDGTGLRKVTWNNGILGPLAQFQESLPLLQPGQTKNDLLETNYVTIADYEFNRKSVPQELRQHPADWPHHYTVQQFNFKSENKPFICFEPGNEMTVRYVALGYNHFPVAQARCDGRWIRTLDRPSHVSSSPISDPIIHDEGKRSHWNGLYGMNRMSLDELITFGRSWAYPAPLSLNGAGFTAPGYDKSQRCYQIVNNSSENGRLDLTLQGSKDSPIVNPAFRIKNWNADTVSVLINDQKTDQCRIGFHQGLEGTDLVLFVFLQATTPQKLTLSR